MKKPEYKQNIIACKNCGGTHNRIFPTGENHPMGPTWYIECKCGNVSEWPDDGFTTIAVGSFYDGVDDTTESDIPLIINLDKDENHK